MSNETPEEKNKTLQRTIDKLKFAILEIPLERAKNGNVKINRMSWESLEALAESTKDSYEK